MAAMQTGVAQLEEALKRNRIAVFTAPTGCGKSTGVPRFLAEMQRNSGLKVACTQPRRMAATSLAKSVAESMGTNSRDGFVSHKVRYDNTTNATTQLVFMTDGALLMEIKSDDQLSEYSAVVVDEAHERSLSTELLLCQLKTIVAKNKKLWLVIMSATLDARVFVNHYDGCELVAVTDIQKFPVNIVYTPEMPRDVVLAAAEQAAEIHLNYPSGHVLIFLAGVDDIDRCYSSILVKIDQLAQRHDLRVGKYQVIKLHAKQHRAEQNRALEEYGYDDFRDNDGEFWRLPTRKLVIATNIAEASITVGGLAYVIDSGQSKRMSYDWKTRLETLTKDSIDQASATQRSGRTGRTCPGTAFRMYTEEHYNTGMHATRVPDVVKCSPIELILSLSQFGVRSVMEYDFIDPPDVMAVLRGVGSLDSLGAFAAPGTGKVLSKLGEKMAQLPVTPEHTVSLKRAHELGVVGLMIALVAMVEEGTDCFVVARRPGDQAACNRAHAQFHDSKSEHWRLVKVFLLFKENVDRNGDGSNGRRWCDRNFVLFNKLEAASKSFDQLKKSVANLNWGVNIDQMLNPTETDRRNVLKSFLKGNFMQVAMRRHEFGGDSYTLVHDNLAVVLNRTSQEIIGCDCTWVMCSKMYQHRRVHHMSCCSAVDVDWMLGEAGDFFRPNNFQSKVVRAKISEFRPSSSPSCSPRQNSPSTWVYPTGYEEPPSPTTCQPLQSQGAFQAEVIDLDEPYSPKDDAR